MFFSRVTMLIVALVTFAACKQPLEPKATPTSPEAATTQPETVDPATKRAAVQKLLDITGTTDVAKDVIAESITQYRQMYPKVPADVWVDVQAGVNANGLTERLAPLYEKHFSYDEIQGMLAFYETPLGQKLLTSMPELAQSTDQISRQWGQDLGNQIVEKLSKTGF